MTKKVNYELDMANTWQDLYAHVTLENVDIGPGDAVACDVLKIVLLKNSLHKAW